MQSKIYDQMSFFSSPRLTPSPLYENIRCPYLVGTSHIFPNKSLSEYSFTPKKKICGCSMSDVLLLMLLVVETLNLLFLNGIVSILYSIYIQSVPKIILLVIQKAIFFLLARGFLFFLVPPPSHWVRFINARVPLVLPVTHICPKYCESVPKGSDLIKILSYLLEKNCLTTIVLHIYSLESIIYWIFPSHAYLHDSFTLPPLVLGRGNALCQHFLLSHYTVMTFLPNFDHTYCLVKYLRIAGSSHL